MNSRTVNTIRQKPKNIRIRKNIVRANELSGVKVKSISKKAPKDVDNESMSEDVSNELLDIEEKNICKPTHCKYGGNNKKLCDNETCEICRNRSFASSNRAQTWSDKNIVKPREVFLSSHEKYLFDCNVCNHEIKIRPHDIKNGNWCGYCGNKMLCSDLNCELCKNKSFISSDKAQYWSKKNNVTPREVFNVSSNTYLFNCNICDHEFKIRPNQIKGNGWCPYCANKLLCSDTNCKICFDKSFASSDKSHYWAKSNDISTREVFKSSHGVFLFTCDVCKHDFDARLGDITKGDRWCPFCSNHRLCSNDNCKICWEKSFASSQLSIYWSIYNVVTPREVFKSSSTGKYIFDCNICGHEYRSLLNHVTAGAWCTCTRNKTENKLKKWFIENGYNIIWQEKYEWCKNSKTDRYLPFDFVIESLKIIIELDGKQHFEQVAKWDSPEKNMRHDIYKMKCAIENGYTIIRLLQKDVWSDKNNWEQRLKSCINTRLLENKLEKVLNIRTKKQYYFFSSNREYLDHEILLKTALLKK